MPARVGKFYFTFAKFQILFMLGKYLLYYFSFHSFLPRQFPLLSLIQTSSQPSDENDNLRTGSAILHMPVRFHDFRELEGFDGDFEFSVEDFLGDGG